ncbi:hypothetical protein RKD41_006435 [Streptomyces tendae]
MRLHIREQGAAPANGDVEQAVVEPAILRGREFPMGMYTTFTEFVSRLFECGPRGNGIET